MNENQQLIAAVSHTILFGLSHEVPDLEPDAFQIHAAIVAYVTSSLVRAAVEQGGQNEQKIRALISGAVDRNLDTPNDAPVEVNL